ncbi:uncharacterized protein LOC144654758 [Oculina patagonica]
MPLATCSKFLRPSLSRISPVLRSLQLSRCRLFSSLEKRPNLVSSRLKSRHVSDGSSSQASPGEWPISDNALVVLGFSLLGSTLFFAVYSGLLDPEGVRSKIPGGSRKRAEEEEECDDCD